jgi:cation diffusion facilitator CzcD-associated flavoprotein CzcO
MSEMVDVVIVGAGPYGLSIAAHLSKTRVSYRIFGAPMETWLDHMPAGMKLKSDGFASNLYDPESAFTLQHYCGEKNLPYADVGIPVPLETFVSYGLEFSKRFVPQLEHDNIIGIQRSGDGFELKTAQEETVRARKVVVAVGITHFPYLPQFLSDLPEQYVSHSFKHGDLGVFKGKKVAVIGAGASAVDTAAILNKSGAGVSLIARRPAIAFHKPSKEPRPLLQRIAKPRSGLGPGWRSRLCTDAPLLFHLMPREFRVPIVRKHLGPAPGWFIRDQVIGRFPLHLGATLQNTAVDNGKVRINFINAAGGDEELAVDHVIGATGFRVAISKLKFLDETIRGQIRTFEDTPVLSKQFESSVPGLYMVGIASANSFGPLTRFAYGAKFTSKRISAHLAQRCSR